MAEALEDSGLPATEGARMAEALEDSGLPATEAAMVECSRSWSSVLGRGRASRQQAGEDCQGEGEPER